MKIKYQICEAPLTKIDWFLFGVLAVFCSVFFQHEDIIHTGGSSLAFLRGHIFDFYEYNKIFWEYNNYLPSSYVLFAIWNIPITLFGLVTESNMLSPSFFVVMWYKLLPSMFYFASAIVIYFISIEIGIEKKLSKLGAFIWLTTPIAFFSQFIFGQYDIFMLFFVLLGLLYYFKNDLTKFALFFGIAMTFKYFSLFLFIPFLLLKEKDILKITKRTLLFLIPFILEAALYIHSQAFIDGVFKFKAASYIFGSYITNDKAFISIFVLGWILICAWAYFTEPQKGTPLSSWLFYFSNLVLFLLFGLSIFHPQWMLIATPFWVISTIINKRVNVFLLLDVLMMLFFTIYTVNSFPNNVDQHLFNLGLLKNITQPLMDNSLYMKDFLLKDNPLTYSLLSSIILINAIFKHPNYNIEQFSQDIDKYWILVRVRFVIGVLIFIVPAFVWLFMAL